MDGHGGSHTNAAFAEAEASRVAVRTFEKCMMALFDGTETRGYEVALYSWEWLRGVHVKLLFIFGLHPLFVLRFRRSGHWNSQVFYIVVICRFTLLHVGPFHARRLLLVCLSAFLRVSWFACVLLCLFASLLFCLIVCLFACFRACLFACLLVCLFACGFACLRARLFS